MDGGSLCCFSTKATGRVWDFWSVIVWGHRGLACLTETGNETPDYWRKSFLEAVQSVTVNCVESQ